MVELLSLMMMMMVVVDVMDHEDYCLRCNDITMTMMTMVVMVTMVLMTRDDSTVLEVEVLLWKNGHVALMVDVVVVVMMATVVVSVTEGDRMTVDVEVHDDDVDAVDAVDDSPILAAAADNDTGADADADGADGGRVTMMNLVALGEQVTIVPPLLLTIGVPGVVPAAADNCRDGP